MGNTQSETTKEESLNGESVFLNVYHMQDSLLNTPGFGVHHSGVEIYGTEYAFAGHETSHSSGVFSHRPRFPSGNDATEWIFKEQVLIGVTKYSKQQVQGIITSIKQEYIARTYDPITKNCNHFSNDLCQKLTEKIHPSLGQ